MRLYRIAHCSLFLLILIVSASAQTIQLRVNLTDAPRNLFHAQLTFSARPGEFTLVYPKWIPGNHRPSGPIANLTGLHFECAGKTLAWRRDPVDMYAFHVTIPPGVSELKASLDLITSDSAGAGGLAASSNLLDLNWNQVVLYPQDANSDAVQIAASVTLPPNWKFGTALPVANRDANEVTFQPVSLTTLVDSPLLAGLHYRQLALTAPGDLPVHVMDMVADDDADLEMSADDLNSYKKLVAEAGALFGARHYRQYHFLYTLSGQVGEHGVEHHESSDNSARERTLLDPKEHLIYAALLPHEYVHSWNGKYRRPAGLATRNYQEPMIGDLLWVYEGLTEYLGDVLTARSGLWTPEQYRDTLALTAAMLDHRAGRTWRPLEDTAISVQTLRMLGPQWASWRRGLDYYPEGELIWLEVDATIRQQTHGQRSLDDFCRRFHGGESGPPRVVPYTFDDVVSGLNAVALYNWAGLLKERVQTTSSHAPLGGIERGGWRLVYNDQPNLYQHALEEVFKTTDLSNSLGITVSKEGEFEDVIPGMPAFQAGLGPGMKLVAVNGRRWSASVLRTALRSAQSSHQPIELLVENGQFFRTYPVAYYDGEKIPHLERVASQPDLLTDILKSRTTSAPGGP